MKWLMMGILAMTAVAIGPARADSLYNRNQYRPLVADHRAYRLGDNLTVLITEIASVSTTANTTISKNESISANLITRKNSADVGAGLGNDFDGSGRIERTGRLLAHLTASVLSVEPNGDLWIKGEQEIEVNNERQWLSLEGRVRVEDIAADNTVSSTRVSEARIKYTGNGLLAKNQTPNIFTRFLRWLRIL
jgi:flagellar L-ring protein FlgH